MIKVDLKNLKAFSNDVEITGVVRIDVENNQGYRTLRIERVLDGDAFGSFNQTIDADETEELFVVIA